jgi:hypothetical protein
MQMVKLIVSQDPSIMKLSLDALSVLMERRLQQVLKVKLDVQIALQEPRLALAEDLPQLIAPHVQLVNTLPLVLLPV